MTGDDGHGQRHGQFAPELRLPNDLVVQRDFTSNAGHGWLA
jgi:hypothetical protein